MEGERLPQKLKKKNNKNKSSLPLIDLYSYQKCIIAISRNLYLAHSTFGISFNRAQVLHYNKNSGKIVTTVPLR